MKTVAAMSVVLCGLLCSCSGMKSNQPPPTVYVVKAENAGGEKAAKNLSIVVVPEPSVPAGFESDKIIVYLDGGRRLDYAAGANWPAPLSKMLQGFTLQSAQGVGSILAVTPEAGVTAGYRLGFIVNDFEPVYAGNAVGVPELKVSLTFTLVSLKTDKLVDTFTIVKTQAASANSLTAITAGMESILSGMMSEALQRLAPQMARAKHRQERKAYDDQESEQRLPPAIEKGQEPGHL